MGESRFTPTKRRSGKGISHAPWGGTQSFEVVLMQDIYFSAMLKRWGGGGLKHIPPLYREGEGGCEFLPCLQGEAKNVSDK